MHWDEFLKHACPPQDLAWRKFRRKAARKRALERIRELGLGGFGDYLAWLRTHPDEAAGLANRLRVTVSRFFREREIWEGLGREVLPELARQARGRRLRLVSVGCCGGEEPYSLALLWRQRVAPALAAEGCEPPAPVILALDLDPASLARAGRAEYGPRTLREVPRQARERWTEPAGGGLRLRSELAGMVRFARADLQAGLPVRPADLILCRYLAFTYYTGGRQRAALAELLGRLRPGGALVVGQKELADVPDVPELAPWPGAPCVFRRT